MFVDVSCPRSVSGSVIREAWQILADRPERAVSGAGLAAERADFWRGFPYGAVIG